MPPISLHGIRACGCQIKLAQLCCAIHFNSREENYTMNIQLGSALPTEKLDRKNFASWECKMHQYLVSQGSWSYIEGAHKNQPNLANSTYPTWEQAASHQPPKFYRKREHWCM